MRYIIFLLSYFFANCDATPFPIVSLKDSWRDGGIMRTVDFAYSMGFNMAFVPLQKTKDEYARFVVSSNPEISKQTMMQYHQNAAQQAFPNPLLGEFLGSTANTIKVLLMTIEHPEDVETIVHELSLSPRASNTFVLVIPETLAAIQKDKSDAISRYRALVPDGDIILYRQDPIKSQEEAAKFIKKAKDLEICKIAVHIDMVDTGFVKMVHAENISIGAFFADSKSQIQKTTDLDVDFFTTQEPLTYLSVTSNRVQKNIPKAHAAVFFG